MRNSQELIKKKKLVHTIVVPLANIFFLKKRTILLGLNDEFLFENAKEINDLKILVAFNYQNSKKFH